MEYIIDGITYVVTIQFQETETTILEQMISYLFNLAVKEVENIDEK